MLNQDHKLPDMQVINSRRGDDNSLQYNFLKRKIEELRGASNLDRGMGFPSLSKCHKP